MDKTVEDLKTLVNWATGPDDIEAVLNNTTDTAKVAKLLWELSQQISHPCSLTNTNQDGKTCLELFYDKYVGGWYFCRNCRHNYEISLPPPPLKENPK